MKKLLVRFLLKSGSHMLDVLMSEYDAKDTLAKWKEGNTSVFSGYDQEQDRHWVVRADEITSIFTSDYNKMVAQAQQRPAPTPYYGGYQGG